MIITKEVEFHLEQIHEVINMYIKDRCVSRALTEDEKHHIRCAWEAGTNTKWDESCSACWRKALKAFEKAMKKASVSFMPGGSYTNKKAEPSKEIKEWVEDNLNIEHP